MLTNLSILPTHSERFWQSFLRWRRGKSVTEPQHQEGDSQPHNIHSKRLGPGVRNWYVAQEKYGTKLEKIWNPENFLLAGLDLLSRLYSRGR